MTKGKEMRTLKIIEGEIFDEDEVSLLCPLVRGRRLLKCVCTSSCAWFNIKDGLADCQGRILLGKIEE